MSTSDILTQLNDYMYQIKIINESLQSLITESNKPRVPTLTGLNLTSNIIVNRSEGCIIEITSSCGSPTRQCITNVTPFIKVFMIVYIIILFSLSLQNNNVIVYYSCNATPVSNSSTVVGVIENLYDPDLNFRCFCYAISGMVTNCGTTIHRCPYMEAVPALTATFTNIFSN